MALRHVLGEYVLEGTLTAVSALAIGSGEPGPLADLGCFRDGAGRLCIPGSALAGVLSAVPTVAGWGSTEQASLLYVEDAPLAQGGAERVELRDGVGLDRRTGSAAAGVLYARETVATGSTFSLQLRVEAVAGILSKADAQTWISAIAGTLTRGYRLGAATSRGLGEVKLTQATLQWRGIGDRAGLLALLAGSNPQQPLSLTAAPESPQLLRITVPWQQRSPLLVSVATNGLVDKTPLTTGSTEVRLVLPGSSIKGALRSRAERIVRTVTNSPLPAGDFLQQMAQDLGPVGRLFGLPPTKTGGSPSKGRQGALVAHECYSKVVPDWTEIQRTLAGVSTGQAQVERNRDRKEQRAAATNLLKNSELRITDHVAISRWTGGADPGKLFATVAPGHWYRWPPLEFTVDLNRLCSDPPSDQDGPEQEETREREIRSALMLLLYVLRDLAEGWIALGYGGTRGYGEVCADQAKITVSVPKGAPYGLEDLNGTLDALFATSEDHPLLKHWLTETGELKARTKKEEANHA